ncbi:hypothetical protein ACOI1H_16170 [Loktanella sp. DJP18]|uniref:hypothetical protein n=1 Tax=Loktanella sp. DJP18 TaxID=3409788 RepID=UPI003BB51FDE
MARTVHYIGFRGDEFTRAFQIYGGPVMIHRVNDARTQADIDDGVDIAIYANKEREDRVREIPGPCISGPGYD